MQLERRELDREPLRPLRREGDLGEGRPDVPDGRGATTGGRQQMPDQGGGGRLAVGAGDGDGRHLPQRLESELGFGADRHLRRAGRRDRRGVGRHPGRHHAERRPADPGQVVAAELDLGAVGPQRGSGRLEKSGAPRVGGVDRAPLPAEQPGRRDAAPPEPDDGDLAGHQRSLSVARATSAQKMPMM